MVTGVLRERRAYFKLERYKLVFELFPGTTMSLRKTARVGNPKGGITSDRELRAELVRTLAFSVH